MNPRNLFASVFLSVLCLALLLAVAEAGDDRRVERTRVVDSGDSGRISRVTQLPFSRENVEGGRLSPASLDMDTCGCPTDFGDPFCSAKTEWELNKTTEDDLMIDPDGNSFLFDVEVVEGPSQELLRGTGFLRITNSGESPVFLSSVVASLEKPYSGQGPNPDPAPGPSGQNYMSLMIGATNESRDCRGPVERAETCYGTLYADPGARRPLLFDPDTNDMIALTGDLIFLPTADNDGDGLRDEDPALPEDPSDVTDGCSVIDNDGDGQYDEDPPNGIDDDLDGQLDEDGPDDDGDGLVDEDGACADGKVIKFNFQFDISGLDLEGEDLRLSMFVTFYAGGQRGGICSVDADCDGTLEEQEQYVRTIQQRLNFQVPTCDHQCETVTLVDNGATSGDDGCADVASNTIDQSWSATGIEGTTAVFPVSGDVSCAGSACTTTVTNKATLGGPQCAGRVQGSPATASFDVECTGASSALQVGDFCTRTQDAWGMEPVPGNPGALVHDNFAALFSSGLIVGDPGGPDSDWVRAALFDSAQALTDYLPVDLEQEPRALTADLTDPMSTSAGLLGGRLVAARLNVVFDAAGIGTSGSHAPGTLASLTFADGCVASGLSGKSVAQVIGYANCAISSAALDPQADCGAPGGVTLRDLSDALGALNANFADCDSNLGCLELP